MALSRGSPRVAVNNHPALWSPDVPRRCAQANLDHTDATARPTRPSRLQCYVAMELTGAIDLTDALFLIVAGFAAGAVNAVAGGGSLITFPTLIAVGLAPVPANVTNSIAVSPGYVASVYGSRTELGALVTTRGRAAVVVCCPRRSWARSLAACSCWPRRRARSRSSCRSWFWVLPLCSPSRTASAPSSVTHTR